MNAFATEAILLRWGENNASGRTVTFVLPDDGTEHPFKGFKTGADHGQRMGLAFTLIADDETQHTPHSFSRHCALACKDPAFWAFLNHTFPDLDLVKNPTDAAGLVRRALGISSRSELDTDPVLADKWTQLHSQFSKKEPL